MTLTVCDWSGGEVDWQSQAIVLDEAFHAALFEHCTRENGYIVLAGIAALPAGEELGLYRRQLDQLVRELEALAVTPLAANQQFEELLVIARAAIDEGLDLALRGASPVDPQHLGPEKLPLLATLREAGRLMGLRHVELLRALAIPVLALSILSQGPMWTVFLRMPLWAIFAVSCHRVVLWNADSLPHRWGLYFTMRELRFAWRSLLVMALLSLPVFVRPTQLMFATSGALGSSRNFLPLGYLLVAQYFAARVCLVFPATALDQEFGFGHSWNATRSNAFRLALLIMIPAAAMLVMTALLYPALGRPPSVLHWAASIPMYALHAFGIVLISVAFRSLCPTRTLPAVEGLPSVEKK